MVEDDQVDRESPPVACSYDGLKRTETCKSTALRDDNSVYWSRQGRAHLIGNPQSEHRLWI